MVPYNTIRYYMVLCNSIWYYVMLSTVLHSTRQYCAQGYTALSGTVHEPIVACNYFLAWRCCENAQDGPMPGMRIRFTENSKLPAESALETLNGG